jgi:hypothetical protein
MKRIVEKQYDIFYCIYCHNPVWVDESKHAYAQKHESCDPDLYLNSNYPLLRFDEEWQVRILYPAYNSLVRFTVNNLEFARHWVAGIHVHLEYEDAQDLKTYWWEIYPDRNGHTKKIKGNLFDKVYKEIRKTLNNPPRRKVGFDANNCALYEGDRLVVGASGRYFKEAI